MDMPRCFFFLEAIGIDTGESPHQSGFAVVDVAGSADNDVLHLDDSHPSASGRSGLGRDSGAVQRERAPPIRAALESTPTFKTGVSDVRVDVQVTEGDKLIKDLTKERFRGHR